MTGDFWQRLQAAVTEGQAGELVGLVTAANQRGYGREEILNQGLVPGMRVISEGFERQEICLPEVLLSVRAVEAALDRLGPGRAREARGRVVIGTVAGDLHDLGKRIIALLLRSEGVEVIDLGTDVSGGDFVAAVERYRPDILAMSALLTTTVGSFRETIELLEAGGKRKEVWVMVGGAPVTAELARAVGADAFARDGLEAAAVVRQLLRRSRGGRRI